MWIAGNILGRQRNVGDSRHHPGDGDVLMAEIESDEDARSALDQLHKGVTDVSDR